MILELSSHFFTRPIATALALPLLLAANAAAGECEPHWDGTIGQPGMSYDGTFIGAVQALEVFDDGSGAGAHLYAGGEFTSAGGVTVNNLAKWNGSAWSALGSETAGPGSTWVSALKVFNDGSASAPALFVGGKFETAGSVTVSHIAKWDGSAWSSLGGGMAGDALAWVSSLTVFDDGSGDGPALYAGGNFHTAGGVAANRIAKWDGSAWSALGSGMSSSVQALTVFDDGSGAGPALYAGGNFTTAGDATVNRIAKWDGLSWLPLGSGMSGPVRALTVFDDGSGPALYAGGSFTTAGGVQVNRIAKWDGLSWSPLGSGMSGPVRALIVFDDGGGPALYAGGQFTTAEGQEVNYIAKWNGASWSTVGSGMDEWVQSFATFDDGSGSALYTGGRFATAGGKEANRIAKWQGCPPQPKCAPADLNCDGVVGVADLLMLLAAWGPCDDCPNTPCPADLTDSCSVGVADLLILLGSWG